MRPRSWLPVCGVLVLASCSGSDGDADTAPDSTGGGETSATVAKVVPVDNQVTTAPLVTLAPPRVLDEEELLTVCPSADALSAATGLDFERPQGIETEDDVLGVDTDAGTIVCDFLADDALGLVVTLHGGDIDTAFFTDDLPGAIVTTLESGLLQLQFEDQLGCEVYGDQVSVIAFTDDDTIDACGLVADAYLVTQQA